MKRAWCWGRRRCGDVGEGSRDVRGGEEGGDQSEGEGRVGELVGSGET